MKYANYRPDQTLYVIVARERGGACVLNVYALRDGSRS